MPSFYEIASLMRGGNIEINQEEGDFIYIGEYNENDDKFDKILNKFVGGMDFDCKKCPQKKTMEWVSSFIKDYLKDISKHT